MASDVGAVTDPQPAGPAQRSARRPRAGGWRVVVLLVATGVLLGVAGAWFLQGPVWESVAGGEVAGEPWQAEARIAADGALLVRLSHAGARTEIEVALPREPGEDGVLAEPFNVGGAPFLVGSARDSVGAVTVEFEAATTTIPLVPLAHVDGRWRAVALPWEGTVVGVDFERAE